MGSEVILALKLLQFDGSVIPGFQARIILRSHCSNIPGTPVFYGTAPVDGALRSRPIVKAATVFWGFPMCQALGSHFSHGIVSVIVWSSCDLCQCWRWRTEAQRGEGICFTHFLVVTVSQMKRSHPSQSLWNAVSHTKYLLASRSDFVHSSVLSPWLVRLLFSNDFLKITAVLRYNSHTVRFSAF